MLSKNKKYVIGVSGGPDSMALLDMLHHEGYHLIACLVNYHKREDSDLDYEVVQEYCLKNNLVLTYKEVFEYDQGNFQAQARNIRYDFYKEVATLHQCEGVILAHHFDDYLETVLMQKDRHQEDGLWGIQEISKYQDLNVYRPAMAYTKQQLLDYCHTHYIDYRIDSSNLETDYTRNKIRHHILKHYTQEQKEALYHEAQVHNAAYLTQHAYCQDWLNRHCKNGILSLSDLQKEEDKEAILRVYLSQVEGMDVSRISKKLITNCMKSLMEKSGNVQINLPVNFKLIKEYDNIYVTRINEVVNYCFKIETIEEKDYAYFKVCFEGHDRCGIAVKESDFPLMIRTFQPGDTIALSYGKKKVSRLFIDAKIPRQKRDLWPIVINAKGEILLIPKIAKNKDYLLAKPTWFVIQ